MISALLILFACFFNAIMDALENENFYESIFSDWDKSFWYKRMSWKSSTKVFGYVVDAWHLAKSAMIICFVLAAVAYTPIVNEIVDVLIYGAIWNISFNIFYHRLFGVR